MFLIYLRDKRPVTYRLVALVTYAKYLYFGQIINTLKLKTDMSSSVKSSGISLDVCKLLFIEQFSRIFNVSVNQKTRSSICFQTFGRPFQTLGRAVQILNSAFEALIKNRKLGPDFEKLSRVLVL